MGIIKDSIGQALGAGQLNSGLNKPFSRNNDPCGSASPQRYYSSNPSDNQYPPRSGYDRTYLSPSVTPYDNTYSSRMKGGAYQASGYYRRGSDSHYGHGNEDTNPPAWNDAPPAYDARMDYSENYGQFRPRLPFGGSSSSNSGQSMRSDYHQPYDSDRGRPFYNGPSMQSHRMTSNSGFRPLALPQIDYGDGQPFLRGYSDELRNYCIEEQQFINILDNINEAIIPNPENQIFQKAANIAGWFVPGSAGLALMGGQLAVGLGAAFGHSSLVNKTLAKANLEVFVPQGLEICLGDSKSVQNELGISSQYYQQGPVSPESRLASYGDRVSHISIVYPPIQHAGRSDPIAMLGKKLGAREQSKKAEKAAEAHLKGKNSKDANALENNLKWLLVRKASPGSRAQWRKTLQQSEAALEEEQRRQLPPNGGR